MLANENEKFMYRKNENIREHDIKIFFGFNFFTSRIKAFSVMTVNIYLIMENKNSFKGVFWLASKALLTNE